MVWWLEQSFLTDQIIVGIPTYARTWTMTSESRVSGIPPIVAGGPGAEGLHTRTPERRTLSYAEVCSRFTEDFLISPKVSRVVEVHKKKRQITVIWLTISRTGLTASGSVTKIPKALQPKHRTLLPDHSVESQFSISRTGTCTRNKFPIVRAVRSELFLD